jgi:hypothetical protein
MRPSGPASTKRNSCVRVDMDAVGGPEMHDVPQVTGARSRAGSTSLDSTGIAVRVR